MELVLRSLYSAMKPKLYDSLGRGMQIRFRHSSWN